jgi:hypothetical protein
MFWNGCDLTLLEGNSVLSDFVNASGNDFAADQKRKDFSKGAF